MITITITVMVMILPGNDDNNNTNNNNSQASVVVVAFTFTLFSTLHPLLLDLSCMEHEICPPFLFMDHLEAGHGSMVLAPQAKSCFWDCSLPRLMRNQHWITFMFLTALYHPLKTYIENTFLVLRGKPYHNSIQLQVQISRHLFAPSYKSMI